MDSKLRRGIDQRWEEFEKLRAAKEHFASILRIADIYGSLSALTRDDQASLCQRCDQVPLDEGVIDAIGRGLAKQEDRISKILSTGETWNEDELLLVVTMRVQNDLIRAYLKHRGHMNMIPEMRSNRAVDLLNGVLASGANRSALFKALNLASRNWGLPIQPLEDWGRCD